MAYFRNKDGEIVQGEPISNAFAVAYNELLTKLPDKSLDYMSARNSKHLTEWLLDTFDIRLKPLSYTQAMETKNALVQEPLTGAE